MTLLLTIREVHTAFAFVVIFSNALAALLAFVVNKTEVYGGRPFWLYIALAQTTVFIQAILGVALQSDENLPPRDFHYLYGFSMIVFVALLFFLLFLRVCLLWSRSGRMDHDMTYHQMSEKWKMEMFD